MKVRIVAILGSESHSTSRGWSKLSVNGKSVSWRDAISSNWLTEYGDKHARWCECVFEVPVGAEVVWEAGANSGSRGRERKRENLVLIADPDVQIFESTGVGYPASDAIIKGRLGLKEDKISQAQDTHQQLVNSL